MSLSYKERRAEARRLLILEILGHEPDVGMSVPFLVRAIDAVKEVVGGEELRGHVSWLAERELVTTEEMDGMLLVTLTWKGRDVAKGAAKVDGVAAPMPWVPSAFRG